VLARGEGARGMIGNDESALSDTEVHYLRSAHVRDEFKILIGHCGSSESDPPPVLFLGDPSFQFGTAVEMIRLLSVADHLPALLVVGVGYRSTTITEILDLRCRDFTPTVGSSDLGDTWDSSDTAMAGGAGRFLAFIRDELKPWVRDRYGVDPDDSAFFGDSLGGLFATYVLLSEPATFRGYGIGSPWLLWDNEVTFVQEAEYARAHNDLAAKVFFSVGALENAEGRKRFCEQLSADKQAKAKAEDEAFAPPDVVADTERMAALLRGRAYPSLEIECEVLPGEYHETAPPLNLSRSLRYLFDAPR
jgi:predicted alpha/beta superfamily hydrolase